MSSWNGHATLLSGVSGRRDQLGQRRDVVRQVGDEVLVVLALDCGRIVDLTEIVAGIVDVAIDRLLEHRVVGIRRDQRFGRMLGRLEIVRSGVHLAAERQSGCPGRQLEQDLEEFRIGERSDRNLDGHLVVAMKDDRDAAGLEAFDRRGEQISGGALDDVFDEGAKPSAIGFPLAAGVVHELDVGRRVLELAGNEPRLRVGDGAAARQRQRQIAVGEGGDDRRLRRWRDQDRLPGADGDADGAREILPELARGRMRVAPLLNDGLDLLVGARIVRDDAAPGSDRSAKSGRRARPPLPSWRSASVISASAGFCSILRAMTRYGSSVCVAGLLVGLIGDELPASRRPARPARRSRWRRSRRT